MSTEPVPKKKQTKKIRVLADYNVSVIPPPIGRANPGVYCFFNSLMSILYSCPIFIEKMLEAVKNEKSHGFCKSFVQEYNIVKEFKPYEVITKSNLINHLMNGLKNSEETKDADYHKSIQESDPIEGLDLMLNMLKKTNPEIYNIFNYRYRRIFTCDKCEQICHTKPIRELTHRMFKIHPVDGGTNEEIFTYNLECYKSTFDDYACPICNGWKTSASDSDDTEHDTKNAIRTSGLTEDQLSIIPEVIGIQINHTWNSQANTNVQKNQYFPMKLKFKKAKSSSYLHYKLIGQIEQSGTSRGGHYWARCLRNDGVYMINDSSVKKSKFECTPKTCYVMYHHYIPDLA